MNFHIKCHHTECGAEMLAEIEQKIDRFGPLLPENAFVELELTQHAKMMTGGGDKEAEILVDIPGVSPVIRFTHIGQTFMESIDRILDKLDEELSEQKDHKQNPRHEKSLKEQIADDVNSITTA